MTENQYYLLLGILMVVLVMVVAIVIEVFVDTDLKLLKRSVRIKTLQAQDQVLSMKMQGMFQEVEGKPINEDGKSSEQPNAIGYGVKRD